MGGDSTSVSLDTTNVYVEAAFWHPLAIQGRARRFNFSTDAGHRFERGVDWATIPAHLDRITALILEICGGEAGPLDDQVVNVPERKPVTMRMTRAQKVIGVAVSPDEMSGIFTRLGLPHRRTVVESTGGTDGAFIVYPPSYRFDLEIEEDLIEEIARIYGFDNIPAMPPLARATMRSQPEAQRSLHTLRARMASQDYFEVINYSFVDDAWERELIGNSDPIKLLNPIASQMAVMRSSLIPGMLANIQYNVSHKADRVRVFELGKVFARDSSIADGPLTVAGISQPLRLAGVAFGGALPEQWASPKRTVDFFDVKADLAAVLPDNVRFEPAEHPLLHPGRSARIMLNGATLGWIGELHPKHLARFELPSAPIVFELDVAPLQQLPVISHVAVSKQPLVRRDMALVVANAVNSEALVHTLRQAAPAYVRGVDVFDVYRGAGLPEGAKSVAIRVLMQDTERTLADTEIEAACQQMLIAAKQQHGAALRT